MSRFLGEIGVALAIGCLGAAGCVAGEQVGDGDVEEPGTAEQESMLEVSYTSEVLDWGYDAGREWVDFNGDGKADYCRRVGSVNNQSSYVSCTVSTGTGFGATHRSGVLDWGHDAGRRWVDFNSDGKADYCRVIGSVNFERGFRAPSASALAI